MSFQDKMLHVNYYYVVPMSFLTTAEQQFFDLYGYLIVRQMTAVAQIKILRELTEQHLSQVIEPLEYEADVAYPGAPESRQTDGGHTVRRLLQAYQRHHAFAEWGTNPDLLGRLSDLLDSKKMHLVQTHHNCVMTKQPRFSSVTMWHQDFRYWRFQHNALVTAWLALGKETARNGCMRVIPGSHRMPFAKAHFDEASFFRTDNAENRALIHQAIRVELMPGDVLLFHSGLLHAAGRNHTDEEKLALVFTYRATDNQALTGTRSASQPDIALMVPAG